MRQKQSVSALRNKSVNIRQFRSSFAGYYISNGVRNPHKLSYHIQTLLFIENEEVSMIDVRVEK